MPNNKLDLKLVNANFSRAAASYDSACILQNKVLDELLEFLDNKTNKRNYKHILDLGCGTGGAINQLSNRYKDAKIIGADQSWAMVQKAYERNIEKNQASFVVGDSFTLPFAPLSFDLIFSNLMLQWCLPLQEYLGQIKNSLSQSSLFIFSTLAKPTLWELRQAWGEVDDYVHVNNFLSKEQVHTALQSAGFKSFDIKTKRIIMGYKNVKELVSSLKDIGAVNSNIRRAPGLTGSNRFRAMTKAYEQFRQKEFLPATYQVVYTSATLE